MKKYVYKKKKNIDDKFVKTFNDNCDILIDLFLDVLIKKQPLGPETLNFVALFLNLEIEISKVNLIRYIEFFKNANKILEKARIELFELNESLEFASEKNKIKIKNKINQKTKNAKNFRLNLKGLEKQIFWNQKRIKNCQKIFQKINS